MAKPLPAAAALPPCAEREQLLFCCCSGTAVVLLLPAACMPLLRSLGASCGEGGSSSASCLPAAPLVLPPVQGCDLTSRLGVSSCTGPADGQGVSSMPGNSTASTPAALCCKYPPAACRGVKGDASPAPAAAAGLLRPTGVMVDRASRGTTALRWPWGVLKLPGAWCRSLLLPSAAGFAAMPEMRPRYGDLASSCALCCCCCEGPLGAASGSPEPCLERLPSASFGTVPLLGLRCSETGEGERRRAAAAALASCTATAAGVCLNRSLYLSLITGTIAAQSREAAAALDPAPGRDIASLSVLRAAGFTRLPAAAGRPLLALPGRAAAVDAAAHSELLPPLSMGELRCPAGALVGLRMLLLVLLNPGRRVCWAPAGTADSEARMRMTCLLSDATACMGCLRRRAALMPLPPLEAAAAAAAAAARCAGFGVWLRCAAAADSAC